MRCAASGIIRAVRLVLAERNDARNLIRDLVNVDLAIQFVQRRQHTSIKVCYGLCNKRQASLGSVIGLYDQPLIDEIEINLKARLL